jgi:hypothetical protein
LVRDVTPKPRDNPYKRVKKIRRWKENTAEIARTTQLSEKERNADVSNERDDISDGEVTSQPRSEETKETSREAEEPVKELNGAGRGSDPPEQPHGLLGAQASIPQSVSINPKSRDYESQTGRRKLNHCSELSATGLVLAEPGDIKIRGIWAARTTPKVFGNSELVNVSHKRRSRNGQCAGPVEPPGDVSGKEEYSGYYS